MLGSVLGTLLFNADLCDLFFILNSYYIASYADDTTTYGGNSQICYLMVEKASVAIYQWFSDNQMQDNADKCHILISFEEKVRVNIGTTQIENNNSEKLLGVHIVSTLGFGKYINTIYGKAQAKTSALGRVARYVNIEKRKIIMNAFFNSQLFQFKWLFHSRVLKQ